MNGEQGFRHQGKSPCPRLAVVGVGAVGSTKGFNRDDDEGGRGDQGDAQQAAARTDGGIAEPKPGNRPAALRLQDRTPGPSQPSRLPGKQGQQAEGAGGKEAQFLAESAGQAGQQEPQGRRAQQEGGSSAARPGPPA